MSKLTQLTTKLATLSYSQAPTNFTQIGQEWKDINITQLSHLAFGTNGKFMYKYNGIKKQKLPSQKIEALLLWAKGSNYRTY